MTVALTARSSHGRRLLARFGFAALVVAAVLLSYPATGLAGRIEGVIAGNPRVSQAQENKLQACLGMIRKTADTVPVVAEVIGGLESSTNDNNVTIVYVQTLGQEHASPQRQGWCIRQQRNWGDGGLESQRQFQVSGSTT